MLHQLQWTCDSWNNAPSNADQVLYDTNPCHISGINLRLASISWQDCTITQPTVISSAIAHRTLLSPNPRYYPSLQTFTPFTSSPVALYPYNSCKSITLCAFNEVAAGTDAIRWCNIIVSHKRQVEKVCYCLSWSHGGNKPPSDKHIYGSPEFTTLPISLTTPHWSPTMTLLLRLCGFYAQ